MRLLILSIQFAPEITSNAAVITGLAQALAVRGHQVTVLAGHLTTGFPTPLPVICSGLSGTNPWGA